MKFAVRSLLIFAALYGLVFAIGLAYLAHINAPLWVAVLFPIALVAIQFIVSPWLIEWVMDIDWQAPLPDVNKRFVENLCAQRGLKVPRIGIIHSGTPNAFTFGRMKSDARVVVTSGLLDVLTPEESNAVIAHEIGHVEHRDFIVMTLAALAPLLLYQLYVFTRGIKEVRPIAYGAYACYWISQFIVLYLNRTREYYADYFSAQTTHAPEALASALVKIGYGLVKADANLKEQIQKQKGKVSDDVQRQRRFAGAMGLMGISSAQAGSAFALTGTSASEAAAVMRWDLVNPWARVYEFASTHPLTALRMRALNSQAEAMHKAPQYPLPQDRQMVWGYFPLELLLWISPPLVGAVALSAAFLRPWLALVGLHLPANATPALLMGCGALWILRNWYRYQGTPEPAKVRSLIEDVSASGMNPRAVELEGEIIGRGVPGAIWSPDLVLRDDTGIMFVRYEQSIPFARFLFALSEADHYIGQKVRVTGWFRRNFQPFVELRYIAADDGKTHRAYTRWVQYLIGAAILAAGYAWSLLF